MRDALSFLIGPLSAILTWFHDTLGLPWAYAIILLTICIRLILVPLTVKQYTSMRAMQKIQPKMKELQLKYKDNKQKLNEELMKLYKEHKVNPFGSCLPLVLQMPILFALYYMILGQPFESDSSFLWISNIKDPSIALVLVYMASQLVSSKLLSAAADKSQQMMMYFMPLIFGVMFLFIKFPAGALIYWVTTNIWTIGQQLIVKEIIHAKESKADGPADMADKTGGKSERRTKSKKKKRQ